jgi:hypothetical protein
MGNIKRVRKAIPQWIARKLWVKAGGRCEYPGCNVSLWEDSLTKKDMNKAYISHIVAVSPKGPRGNSFFSKKLALKFENLLLLCDECHNRIDTAAVDEHPVDYLLKIKRDHEERIELLTSLKPEKRTHILFYGANIGSLGSPFTFNDARQAILPTRFPYENRPIDLHLKNSSFYDNELSFWELEPENLERQFKEKVLPIRDTSDVKHFSIFALAPQPLLIKLGTLISDLLDADVYQKHREPSSWCWQENSNQSDFKLNEPGNTNGVPVLKLELSATVTNERLISVLGNGISIWTITHNNPNVDFLKAKHLLSAFRVVCRDALNIIKAKHGQNNPLHVFPVMPVSACVEFGRIWMPKADLPLVIYDQNRKNEGFFKTITINA